MKKILVLVLCVYILFGCKSTPKNEAQVEVGVTNTSDTTNVASTDTDIAISNITFGDISWIAEQISPSFWPSELKNDSTLFVTFHMPVSQDIPLSTVKTIFISSPKDMWLLEKQDINHILEMDSKDKKLVLKRLQCANGKIPLGEWTIEVTFTDDTVVSKNVTINGMQNESSTETNTSSQNNDKKEIQYLTPVASGKNTVACLTIPVIKSVTRDAETLEIHFSVNDKRIKNGYFWFDVPGEKYYRDSGSMIDASGTPVNGCRNFSTDGKDCTYILRKDAENSSWFSKIVAAYFVVADVNRVQSPWEERIRSVSEKAEIK
ncbi:MAG: hypothetical protein IJU92_09825 [Spirochaetaceae bacterium]|nr:hypothetical protein [Spirochaetaceae bacterium]